jgi:hypothetical protein
MMPLYQSGGQDMTKNSSELFPEPGQSFKVLRLDSYGGECIITTEVLADMAGTSPDVILAAVARKELPRPWPLLGRMVWTQAQLADFFEARATTDNEK